MGIYETIAVSKCRPYSITIGLRAGYEVGAAEFTSADVAKIVRDWISGRKSINQCYLSGVVTGGKVIYEGNDKEGTDEPVAVFNGEVNPKKLELLGDKVVEILLNELADLLGQKLSQEELYLRYCELCWVRKIRSS